MIIIELLKKIKEEDYPKLRSFIAQPYWRLKEADIDFFDAMVRWPKKMRKTHEIYSEKYDRVGEIKKRLVVPIEGYLSLESSRKYPFYQDLMLLDYYNNNGMEACYNSKMKRLKKNLKQYPVDNEQHFFQMKLSEAAASKAKHQREKMPELIEMLEALDQFYAENELRIFCEFATQKDIINTDYPIKEMNSIERSSSLAQLYQQIYNLHTKAASKKEYIYLSTAAIQNNLNLSKEVLHTLHNHLLNYCTKHLNQGGDYFAEEYIRLIQSLISHKLLLDKGILDWGRYGNIVTIYLLLGKKTSNQAQEFIKKYTKYLATDNYKHTKILNLARVYLFENDLEKAEEQYALIQNEYGELSFENKLLFKKLELKIAYLNQDVRLAVSYLNSFRALVSNASKLESNKVEVLRAFASCFHRLIDHKLELDKSFVDNKTLAATDKHWLLSML